MEAFHMKQLGGTASSCACALSRMSARHLACAVSGAHLRLLQLEITRSATS